MISKSLQIFTLIIPVINPAGKFTPGTRYYLPEFGLIKDKIITKIDVKYTNPRAGDDETLTLTLVNDKDEQILVDYPVNNLFFENNNLNRRYLSYFVNVNLAKSFFTSYDPNRYPEMDEILVTLYFINNG